MTVNYRLDYLEMRELFSLNADYCSGITGALFDLNRLWSCENVSIKTPFYRCHRRYPAGSLFFFQEAC